MANILSHVIAGGKQTSCNVSSKSKAEPLRQLCKRTWTISEEECLLPGYIKHIRLIGACVLTFIWRYFINGAVS